jgi:hypothetical protein
MAVWHLLLLSQKKQNPRLMTIFLKTDSDYGGRLRSRSPYPLSRKNSLSILSIISKNSTIKRAQLSRKLEK